MTDIDLTSSAAARVAAIAAKQGKPAILRLAVEGAAAPAFSIASVWPMRSRRMTWRSNATG